jgi:hypothetical protein
MPQILAYVMQFFHRNHWMYKGGRVPKLFFFCH